MFEQSVLAERKRRTAGRALAAAVVAHGVGFGAVLVAGVWTVPAVEAPMLAEIYVDFVPEAPVASGRPAPEPEPAAAQPPAEPPPPAPPVTQPEVVPEDVPSEAPVQEPPLVASGPVDATGPEGGPGRGSPEGVPGGDPDAAAGPGGGGGGEAAVPLDGRMIAPVAIHRVQPRYTERARQARIQGIVIVEATIDRTGRVTAVKVVKPLPFGLDASAAAAVEQWRFTPATLHGRPVPVYFRLTVDFRVH
jgi:protein TonB